MRGKKPRTLLQVVLALTLLTSNCVGQEDWNCVPSCKCIWASGKKTAECKRQNLTEIPDSFSMEIQYLDLTGNYISHLADRAFTRGSLVNLQKLVLRECGIKAVNVEAFTGLKIVIEIDLSGNRIRQLHRGTFVPTERLRVLLLNQNRLERLDDDLFHDLKYLQKVELSDNHLVRIGQSTFRNLPGLQTLTLDGNNLQHLSLQSFEDLLKLSSLELRKNPWNCDCHLKAFRDWAVQGKLYTRPTSCDQPAALVGRMWDEIASDEFACAPRIENIGAMQLGDPGSGRAQLWCRAQAQPRPQISWVHRQRVLGNGTKRHSGGDKSYLLQVAGDWANLTIPELLMSDKGEYICIAKNFGGSVERNVSLLVLGEGGSRGDGMLGLPLAIGLGLVAFLFLLVALTFCLCYCRRQRSHHDEKSAEAASLDHHGLGEQEKSLITAINPVVKPPRRYEAPSVTSHGTEMTELNRTLLDNESVFADGVGSVVGVLANGLNDEERGRATPELEAVMSGHSVVGGSLHTTPGSNIGSGGVSGLNSNQAGSVISGLGTLSRNTTPYRQYPPDLLAFSGGRNSSPTSQASTAPDSSRLPSQHHQQQQQQQHPAPHQVQLGFGSPSSPVPTGLVIAAYTPIGFKTLPHPVRASSATPYSLGHHHPSMSRHGYGTIPRRPRAPSWSSGPPTSPTEREIQEPVYDNLGLRTTADGSSALSLNKSPEPVGFSMRGRPLPATPGSPSPLANGQLTLPRAPRGPPALAHLQLNRSAPEGAPEWPLDLVAEHESQPTSPSARKVPPRPPPKPKKKSPNGPLYEDEGEDGTEV